MVSAQKRGFTLVELLVVISIIAILAAIGLTVYSGAQKQARMSKRISDLYAIQAALELYYNVNKAYPCTGSCPTIPPNWFSECTGRAASDVVPGLVPTYMVAFPADPLYNPSSPTPSCYRYASNGTDYKIQNYYYGTPEMSDADFRTQRNLIDPANDSGAATECATVGTGVVKGWALFSNNTGVNDTTNPACWN